MVTEAGKELLRNTINTAKFHNRILEENVMWKQFELERGLTMMVSDDDVLRRIKKHHQCSKHRKRDKSTERRCSKSKESRLFSAGSSKDDTDRWDHSGFQELYPEECSEKSSSPPKVYPKKWDHSGFQELYPEECCSEEVSPPEVHPKKEKKRKRKHHSRCSSSDTEIWEEFKKYKRSKAKKEKSGSVSSGFDNHVKEWKKHVGKRDKNYS